MQFSLTGILVGALAGLVVTAVVTMIWPKEKLRWLRPLVAPGLGVLVAYMLMRLV